MDLKEKQKVNLVISIDTECDRFSNWEVRQPLAFQNIEDQKTTLFPLFEKHNIKATYLLSPEVLKDDEAMKVFYPMKDKHEFGSHLHVEFIGPEENMESRWAKGVQVECQPEIERQKLENLTHLFEQKMGYQPISFRAGKFGASPKTLKFLAALGYKVDSSFKPFSRMKFRKNGLVDFWGIYNWPYFPSFNNYKKSDQQRRILEAPVTLIQPTLQRKFPRAIVQQMGDYHHISRKIVRKLKIDINEKWLRPQREGLDGMRAVTQWVVKNTPKGQTPLLNMMFHSSELSPGTSPYCGTAQDVADYVAVLDGYFSFLKNNYQVCSIGLGECYEKYV